MNLSSSPTFDPTDPDGKGFAADGKGFAADGARGLLERTEPDTQSHPERTYRASNKANSG